MDEADYWVALEFRLVSEFAGMPLRNRLRCLWCDGFCPGQYLLDDPSPRITGIAWICEGSKQDEWEFTLFLSHPAGSRAEIDWSAHLPPENVTRWLAFDESSKRIQIEPLAAVPDLA